MAHTNRKTNDNILQQRKILQNVEKGKICIGKILYETNLKLKKMKMKSTNKYKWESNFSLFQPVFFLLWRKE
jgi:hypothetical protein